MPHLAAALRQASLVQVDGGDQEIVIIRETTALGPILFGLIGLGFLTLLATMLFWWLTRPEPLTIEQPSPQRSPQGESDG